MGTDVSFHDINQTINGRFAEWCQDGGFMKGNPSLTKAEYEKLAAFRFALRQFLRFSEEAAQEAGVTPQQHQALLAIKGYPGRDEVTVGELAERLQVQHHSAVGLVDRLSAEALVSRKPSALDRRQVNIRLTKKGEKLLAGLVEIHRAQLRRTGPKLRLLLEQLGAMETGE
jgi:DNA-binding MarR family transcriptional regulator